MTTAVTSKQPAAQAPVPPDAESPTAPGPRPDLPTSPPDRPAPGFGTPIADPPIPPGPEPVIGPSPVPPGGTPGIMV